jgi:hypothetical protein
MNDQDYNELNSSLSSVLREKEMVWVIDQVNEQISLGKTESKEIVSDEDYRQNTLPEFVPKRRTSGRGRRKEEFLVTTEYTPKEKLLLLIDAIEQAVVNTSTMVHDTLYFTHREFKIESISFYSVENQREKTFSRADFGVEDSPTIRLKNLLAELRTHINAD